MNDVIVCLKGLSEKLFALVSGLNRQRLPRSHFVEEHLWQETLVLLPASGRRNGRDRKSARKKRRRSATQAPAGTVWWSGAAREAYRDL